VIPAAVVDASVAVKWVVEEPDSGLARTLSGTALEAPDLLFTECANILWKKVRAGDLSGPEADSRLRLLRNAPVRIVPGGEFLPDALRLAVLLNHPVYDCLYLALARRRRLPLVTADQRLASALARKRVSNLRVLLLSTLTGQGRQ
jgi:predicted nucleic acid-binding protein